MVSQSAVSGDAEEPVSEPAPTGVESVEPLDGEHPDFLVDVLGEVTISADKVINHPVDVADMALVHRVPCGTVAPRHRSDKEEFVVHRPATSVEVGDSPQVYCREPTKSFARFGQSWKIFAGKSDQEAMKPFRRP